MASGCLYTGPIPTLEDNVPPEIIETSDIPGGAIEIRTDRRAVFVVADDPDGDEIGFVWALSDDGVIGDALPLNFPSGDGSQIYLDRVDVELDGQRLRCFIDDGESELVTLTWDVVIP
jgi:hypothetical protein